jgi:hypothetical protein
MDELYGFLDQSNISPKNIARLEILAQHASSEVKDLSLLIFWKSRASNRTNGGAGYFWHKITLSSSYA